MCDDNDYGSDDSSSYSSPEPSYSAPEVIYEAPEPTLVTPDFSDIFEDDDDDFDYHPTRNSYSSSRPLKGKRKMAIDFNKLQNAGGHASTLNFSKAQEVTAGERINFSKANPGVSKLRVELYWESDKDGDVAAVLLGADKNAVPGGIVFYNQMALPGITHSGDCKGDVDGDPSTPEETMTIDLNGVNADVDSVVIVAGTHPKEGEDQTKPVPFGLLRDCRVLIINDENSEVLYAFELDEDYSTFTSVELASFYRKNGDWRYTNMGEGVGTGVEALTDFATKYNIK
ncbi:hypothetical protein VPHD148_0082 [Vibrio phage D148]